MIPVEEALGIVLAETSPLGTEDVPFVEARGRVLREDVVSDLDMPPFPRSAVDGFAVRAEDAAVAPVELRVVATIPAGTFPDFRIGRGEAASIMTGAPVPDGADAVQMVEQSRSAAERVTLLEPVTAGLNIAPRGSEVKVGDVVLRAGTRLDAASIAVAATVGKTSMAVGKRPRVAIIATGDELVHPSRTPGPGQIRNSNGFSLQAQCRSVGVDAIMLGVAEDSESSIRKLLELGLKHDVVLLSGGVSMGKFDLVEGVLEELGVRILVDAVALKPGKPLVFGVRERGKLVFGLPGNPVSTMVTFELFVRPAFARLEGVSSPERPVLRAKLLSPLSNRGPRRAYLPGFVTARPGEMVARPVRSRGSGDIVAFAKANALLIVPEDRDLLSAGDDVAVQPLDSFLYQEDRWRVE